MRKALSVTIALLFAHATACGNGSDNSFRNSGSFTAPTPSPDPLPNPSTLDVSGTWTLEDTLTQSCDPSLVGRTSRTGIDIQQDGTALTATRVGPNFREDLKGTIEAAGHLSMRGPFVDESETGESQWDATTLTGSEMTGSYSRFYPAHDCTLRWTFTGSKS